MSGAAISKAPSGVSKLFKSKLRVVLIFFTPTPQLFLLLRPDVVQMQKEISSLPDIINLVPSGAGTSQ